MNEISRPFSFVDFSAAACRNNEWVYPLERGFCRDFISKELAGEQYQGSLFSQWDVQSEIEGAATRYTEGPQSLAAPWQFEIASSIGLGWGSSALCKLMQFNLRGPAKKILMDAVFFGLMARRGTQDKRTGGLYIFQAFHGT